MVTQISEEQLQFPLEEQQHEPLEFIGKAFSDTEQSWTTYEKEGFAILKRFVKFDYVLFANQKVHVFTDHKNLLFLYSPLCLEPNVGSYAVSKVQRWALYMS